MQRNYAFFTFFMSEARLSVITLLYARYSLDIYMFCPIVCNIDNFVQIESNTSSREEDLLL